MNAPYLIKALPRLLTPLAAAGLALTMIGAIATHVGRGDPALSIIINCLLFAMCVTIAVKRYAQAKSGAAAEPAVAKSAA